MEQGNENKLRKTIGLLTCGGENPNENSMQEGVIDAAKEMDINLICYVGGILKTPDGFEAQSNIIYELVNIEYLDGLIIFGGGLAGFCTYKEIENFYKKYSSLPIISISYDVKDIPNITIDNFTGMYQAISHLIKIHGLKKIVFIRGPQEHSEADERYRAYMCCLSDNGISFNPDLVVTGSFDKKSGREAICDIIDNRKIEFDSVIASNDYMAIGAIEELEKRGKNVPYDVPVIGFDNIPETEYTIPSLTTVPHKFYEIGYGAIISLLSRIKGEHIPEASLKPTKPVIRKSCGCISNIVRNSNAGISENMAVTFSQLIVEKRDTIVKKLYEVIGLKFNNAFPAWADKLVDSFIEEMVEGKDYHFFQTLDQVLEKAVKINMDLLLWQDVLSQMRKQFVPYIHNNSVLFRLENLWHQARIIIGNKIKQCESYFRYKRYSEIELLHKIGHMMVTTNYIDKLLNYFVEQMPKLNIHGCYISLYSDREEPQTESRLILAYNKQTSVNIPSSNLTFSSKDLIPKNLFPEKERFTFTVKSLHFGYEQIGFIVFIEKEKRIKYYDIICNYLSTALKATMGFEAQKNVEGELQKTMEKLMRSNEELQQFAYIASHDLQEPLRTVSNYVSLLARRYKGNLDQNANEFINFAEEGAQRMQKLIIDLLTYSRVSRNVNPFRPTNCTDILSNVLSSFKTLINKNSIIITHDQLPTLNADSNQITQLFQNLIDNAIKFRNMQNPQIHIGYNKNGETSTFYIKDNGIGIKSEHLDRIFGIFQRLHTRDKYPGTGIGLSVCQKIVENHGGRIWVESDYNKGSTFFFTLHNSENS